MFKNKSLMMAVGLVVGGIAIAGVLGSWTTSESTLIPDGEYATYAAQQGPLTISVLESGTIQARERVIIKNEVEGHTSIISLVEEGIHVKTGDLLIELDASQKIEQERSVEIVVQNANAAFIQAREHLAVVKNQTKSDLAVAELNLSFAKQDLEKYIEGEYPNQLKAAESSITLAREELLRSQEKLEWSKRLYKENYLSQTELQQDELAASRDKLDLEQAENNMNLLVNYTHKRQTDQLESNVTQAEMALERATRKATADVVQAEVNLRARSLEYDGQKGKLKWIKEQITKTKIYAPSDGVVIYATSAGGKHRHGRSEPMSEGTNVRERQELIHLPTTTSVKAEISIHESSLEKVEINMPARVTMDALPDQVFTGYLATVAPLPDPSSMWMNPDLKVYNADVYLENNGVELRTGMSCKAEIIIDHLEDAVYVPVQSVVRVKGEPTVYVAKGKSAEPRKVEIGLDDNQYVHIVAGLKAGENVMLRPPLADTEVQRSAANSQAPPPVPSHKPVEASPAGTEGMDKDGKAAQMTQGRIGKQHGGAGGASGGRKDLTSEQKKRQADRMAQFQNMSSEEQAKIRQQFQERRKAFENASPEEQEKLRERFRGGK